MIEQKRLWRPTSRMQRIRIESPQFQRLLLAVLATFAGMVLSSAAFPDFGRTVFALIAGALLSGSAIAASRKGNRSTSSGHSEDAVNAGLLTLALLAWSVLLLLILIGWQAAAIAALSLPCLVAMNWLGGQRESEARMLLDSCVTALPAIVGGAVATATVGLPALMLFAIIFFWSLTYSRVTHWRDRIDKVADEFRLSSADEALPNRFLLYALQLVIISMLPALLLPLTKVDNAFGVVYPIVAIGMGVVVVAYSSRLARVADRVRLRQLGDIMSLYPFLLVMALIADRILQ